VVGTQGGQIKNSKFRKKNFEIRKPSEIFFEKSEINQKEPFFANYYPNFKKRQTNKLLIAF
jgi:hypothetical protein